ncbi:hypothetical protein ACFU99_01465 [Streptomyces sp. NPDC057654]|uniref:hypothetical protein n=1 Tax=Streptomyces sp. NPDC057654 TaxID=3346196 RepID=UPI0036B96560
MHWAYIQWNPEAEGSHEITVTADHAHKRCAEKSEDTDIVVDCDVKLPEELRHTVSGESKESVMAAARRVALYVVPYGRNYSTRYIGEVI